VTTPAAGDEATGADGTTARWTTGWLSGPDAAQVRALAAEAAEADGTPPLSDAALLRIGPGDSGGADGGGVDGGGGDSGGGGPVRHLVLGRGGRVAGYVQLEPPGTGAGEAGAGEAGDGDAGDGDAGDGAGEAAAELVVRPGDRRRGLGTRLVRELLAEVAGRPVRVWAHGDGPGALALARRFGFAPVRSLWQMHLRLAPPPGGLPDAAQPGGQSEVRLPEVRLPEVRLPEVRLPEVRLPEGVRLRAFRPGRDEAALVGVNRRAFAWHPEQGAWTEADVLAREAEAWFDAAGVLIAERDGELIGFHWTKVHPAAGSRPATGEVYVLAVDPAAQGGGLGRALTVAGLRYLRDRGMIDIGLYTESDNSPAVHTYAKLGFQQVTSDTAFRLPPP
jgi:mycothiol synthase